MKSALALAALAAAASPSPGPPKWTDATPPSRFQRTGMVPVLFVPSDRIAEVCATVGTPPKGVRIIACHIALEIGSNTAWVVVMPNPCEFAEWDPYARIQCHENAHHLSRWGHETE